MTASLGLSPVAVAGVALGSGILLALAARWALRRVARKLEGTRRAWASGTARVAQDLVPVALFVGGAWTAALRLPLTGGARQATGRALVGLVVLTVTIVVARLAAEGVRAYSMRRAGMAPSTSLFTNITRATVIVIGGLVMLDTFGISITPMLTALGVGGLAVALALQDTLANLFAGVHILASKKIEPGDYIRLVGGEEGYVVDVNWRNTTIRALPNNMVIVPNAQLASGILVNFHRPEQEMSVLVQVGVSYDSDLEQVERVTVEVGRQVMREVEGAVTTHEPTIRYHTFNESSIDFSVVLRAREYTDQYLITHEFIKRLQPRYIEEGIVIPFPIRTVMLPERDTAAGPNGPERDTDGDGAPSAGPLVG